MALLLPFLLVAACDTGPAESLYDPGREALPAPVIASVSPSGAALAGVDVVTLSGQNFVSEPENNLVYFGDERAEVLSASPTEIRVLPPATPAESVGIRVAVISGARGSEQFSETVTYRLEAAVERFGSIGRVEDPSTITTDAAGTLYMGLIAGGVSAGFKTLSPDGVRGDYTASTFSWRDIEIGPDGMLYSVRSIRAVFRFEEGGSQQVFAALTPSSLRLVALAFDPAGNLWTGGDNEELIRVAPDGSATGFAFDANVTALKVFDGALYATAETGAGYAVWRFPLDANNDLGTGEVFFDIAGELGPNVTSEAIAFATDGTLYLGTDRRNPIEIVNPDGSHETLYPGVLVQPSVGGSQIPASTVLDLAWGPDTYLYMLRERPSGDLGADAHVLVRVNTRKNGA